MLERFVNVRRRVVWGGRSAALAHADAIQARWEQAELDLRADHGAPAGLGPKGVAVLKRSGARAVVTMGPEPVEGAYGMLLDHGEVGRIAGAHLVARGRRGIGVVVPEERGLSMYFGPRLDGVQRAAYGTGATVTELPLAYEEKAAAELAARWRSLGLDAVFAYNDEYAMLLMRALQDEGIAVPEETAVIGADNLMLGRLLRPRLSSVHMELPTGRDLAELVDRAVREPGSVPEANQMLGFRVVHRESS